MVGGPDQDPQLVQRHERAKTIPTDRSDIGGEGPTPRTRVAAASTSPATVGRVSAHYVYVVRCADGSLYTGYARDPVARADVHNSGKGAHYTASRRPVTLLYLEGFAEKSDALKREHELKGLRRAAKEALIAAQPRKNMK